ncbi:MAG: trypsin-like peptidase domain-containing protein [Planctomycetota bacterium]
MKRWLYVCLALLLGFGLGFHSMGALSHGQGVAPVALPRELTSFRDIVKQVQPAVVSIESKGKVTKIKTTPRVPDDLKRFFDDNNPGDSAPQHGFGSGFFIDASGIILTNAHVVDGADQVTVNLHDGRKVTSRDIKADSKTDLAIVILDPKAGPYPTLELGDSEAYEIGDRVLAFGAPFGLTGSVTSGIVSAKGRSALSMNMYEDFIQTDAAINPGNSGGPLVGIDGKVVGINSAIKSRTGGFQGVGLAVSSNLAKSIVRALRTDGVVRRGYLGVQIRDLQPEIAERFGLAKGVGVVVGDVFEGSPGSKGGLLAGDIIVAIEGRAIKDGRGLQMQIANTPLKQVANIDVIRDGKKVVVPVTVEEQPRDFGRADVPAPQRSSGPADSQRLEKLGIEIADLTDDDAESFGYRKGTKGIVITKVNPGPAADAGLRKGMLIHKVDSRRVASATEARQTMETASLARGILLQVQSPTGGTNFVLLQVRE